MAADNNVWVTKTKYKTPTTYIIQTPNIPENILYVFLCILNDNAQNSEKIGNAIIKPPAGPDI